MFVLFIMSISFTFLKLCFAHAHTFLLTSFLIGKQTFSISPVRISTYIYYLTCKLKPIKKEFALRKPFISTHMYRYNAYLFHASTLHVFLVPVFVRLVYVRLCLFCTNNLSKTFFTYVCIMHHICKPH